MSEEQKNILDKKQFWLGAFILFTFALISILVLVGCWLFLNMGFKIDVTILPIVTGLVGAIIGSIAPIAQNVVGYYFGSSRGSTEKDRRPAAVNGTPLPLGNGNSNA